MLIGGGHGLGAAQTLGLPGGRNIPKWINDTLAKSSPNRRDAGAPDLPRGQQATIADGQCLVHVDRTLEKGNDAFATILGAAIHSNGVTTDAAIFIATGKHTLAAADDPAARQRSSLEEAELGSEAGQISHSGLPAFSRP